MKKTLTLIFGLLLVAAIGYSSDFRVVKDHLKKEIKEIVTSFDNVTAIKMNVIDEVNVVRSQTGLDKFIYNVTLDQQAQAWAYKMSEDNVTHDIKRSTGQYKGEVILMYEGELIPERIVSEFLNSPRHKQIILNSDYSKIGVGIKRMSGTNYVVMRFI